MANNIKNFIKKNIIIGTTSIPENKESFHITYGTDRRFQYGVGVSIVSVLINNTSDSFIFHIFTDECSEDYESKLKKISKEYTTCIKVHIVDSSYFEHFPSTQVWSHAMYYRLLAYNYLYQQTEKVLYLDADVMCNGNIGELFFFDLKDSVSAVVDDLPSTKKASIKRLEKLLSDKQHYFNSGVMLVNVGKWHENDLTNKSLEMLTTNTSNNLIKYPDQDILNILLSSKTIYLERKYNTIYTLKSELEDKTHKAFRNVIKNDTVFVHFTGITKPWHSWADYASREIFVRAWSLSPWKHLPLLPAESIPEMQKQYKHLFVQGKFLRGFIALIRYKFKK